MKYIFAKNINGSGEAGIIELDSMEVMCLCTEPKSELLLKALSMSDVVKPLICKKCDGYYGININHKCFKCLEPLI